MQQLKRQVMGLLEGKYPPEEAEEIATALSEGRWTHDYPITYEEAKALGLNVSTEIPSEIYQLMSLYRQPVRQQPTVEYLPVPRRQRPPLQKSH
jgi:ClpP class serine protease